MLFPDKVLLNKAGSQTVLYGTRIPFPQSIRMVVSLLVPTSKETSLPTGRLVFSRIVGVDWAWIRFIEIRIRTKVTNRFFITILAMLRV